MTRDIFKDGASPELEAQWNRLDAMVAEFTTASPARRDELLDNRYVSDTVTCPECTQVLAEYAPREPVLVRLARRLTRCR